VGSSEYANELAAKKSLDFIEHRTRAGLRWLRSDAPIQ